MDSSVWNGQDPTLSGPAQDDFQQFLNMNLGDSLQFDFQDFNTQQGQGSQLMDQNEGDAMDTGMDNGCGIAGQDTTMHEHIPMTTAGGHPAIHGAPISQGPSSSESLSELDAQIQYLQHQRHQQQQRALQEQQQNFYASQNRMIPPTPNSIEMHGNNYYQQTDPQQQQAIFERYRMTKEQEVSVYKSSYYLKISNMGIVSFHPPCIARCYTSGNPFQHS